MRDRVRNKPRVRFTSKYPGFLPRQANLAPEMRRSFRLKTLRYMCILYEFGNPGPIMHNVRGGHITIEQTVNGQPIVTVVAILEARAVVRALIVVRPIDTRQSSPTASVH